MLVASIWSLESCTEAGLAICLTEPYDAGARRRQKGRTFLFLLFIAQVTRCDTYRYSIGEFWQCDDRMTESLSLTPHPLWSNPGSYLHSSVPAMLIIAPTFLLVVKLWVLSLGLGWWWQYAVLCHVMSRDGRGDPGMWQVLHHTRLCRSQWDQGGILWTVAQLNSWGLCYLNYSVHWCQNIGPCPGQAISKTSW